jgi:hypothetical protein
MLRYYTLYQKNACRYFKEAVLAVLLKVPLGSPLILTELKKEKRVFAHRNAARKVISWKLVDNESDTR